MDKHLAVINGTQVLDVLVQPGDDDVGRSRRLGLPNEFLLSRRDGLPFGENEDIYGLVRDGEKLYASAPATVGIDREREPRRRAR